MKIIAIAIGLLGILAAVIAYNVWHAENDPVTTSPGPLQAVQMQLQSQLQEAETREGQIEKLYWDSPRQLRLLVNSHQQRIQKLTGNTQASAILAHDREAVARLEKRIAELEAQRLAQAAEAKPAQGTQVHEPPSDLRP
jgi:hypothetical protein